MITINPTKAEAYQFYQRAKGLGAVSVDIETNGLDPYGNDILMIQFGLPGHVLLFIAEAEYGLKRVVPAFMWDMLKEVIVIGHNLKFDYKFLKLLGHDIVDPYDTMIMESCLNLGRQIRVGLDHVVGRRIGIRLDKTVRNEFIGMPVGTPLTDRQIAYATSDVGDNLFEIRRQQLQEIAKLNIDKICRLENKTVLVTAEMELNGFDIDMTVLQRLTDEWERDLLSVCKRIHAAHPKRRPISFGLWEPDLRTMIQAYKDGLNLGSPKQNLEDLHAMGYTRVEDTRRLTLDRLAQHSWFARDLLEFRALDKRLSSFAYAIPDLISPYTGKLHPQHVQIALWGSQDDGGTSTGRWSSKLPNLHQSPRDKSYRSMFLAPPGYKIATADLSGQEMCIATNVTKDRLMAEFYSGSAGTTDFHGYMAHKVFDLPLAEVTKWVDDDGNEHAPPNAEARFTAKTADFSVIYLVGPKGLSRLFPIDEHPAPDSLTPAQWLHYVDEQQALLEEKCSRVLDSYNQQLPGLLNTLRSFGEEAIRKRVLYDQGWGRVRFFDREEEDYRVLRQGANFPIQGNAATQTKYAAWRIRQKYPEIKILGTVHDEIIAAVPEDNAHEYGNAVAQEMIKAATMVMPGPAKYTVGVEIMDHWTK